MTVVDIHRPFATRTSHPGQDARTVAQRVEDLREQINDLMQPVRKAEIAARLKAARERSPYKQREAAQRASVELRTWQSWEAGQRGINRANINIAAKALGVDPDPIWDGVPEEDEAERVGRQLDRIETALTELREVAEKNLALLLALDAWRAERQSSPETQPARRRRAS